MKPSALIAFLLGSLAMQAQPSFPASWQGDWQGSVEVFSVYGQEQSVPMQLRIRPTEYDSLWTWTIIYGQGEEASTRDYRLRPVDAADGHWEIDEQNGIRLDGFLLDDALFIHYELDDLRYTTRAELREGRLEYELTVGRGAPLRITGPTAEVPAVSSFRVQSIQKAFLKKKR